MINYLPCIWKKLIDFMKLGFIVKRHGVDTGSGSISNVTGSFGRICENNTFRTNTHGEHFVDFPF